MLTVPHHAVAPDPAYLSFLGRLLRFIHEENIVWRPPDSIEGLETILQTRSFTTWRATDNAVLSLRGPSRTKLAETSYYLARHLQERERVIVAKFTLRCSS